MEKDVNEMNNEELIEFWRKVRQSLKSKETPKLVKTTENIYIYAKENGIKPAARYFDTSPQTIRNHIRKYEEQMNNN